MSDIAERTARLTADRRRLLHRKLNALSAHTAEAGHQQLLAYYSPVSIGSPAEEAVRTRRIREHLQARLPAYMCPQFIIPLNEFPRLPNGKIDLESLPEPMSSVLRAQAEGEHEEAGADDPGALTLARLLGNLLGMDDVQPRDNFFELGGDSITAIQFVSLAREAGINIEIAALTEQATLADIAASQSGASGTDNSIASTGPTPLTAIQAWFFAQGHPEPQHWNQAGRLRLNSPVAADQLARAVTDTVARCPALGQRFHVVDGHWCSEIPEGPPPNELITTMPASHDLAASRNALQMLQQSFSLERGWMFRVLIIVGADGLALELIWVAHHLIIDELSVQMLLREIESACAASPLEPISNPPRQRSVSLRIWATLMNEVAAGYRNSEADASVACANVRNAGSSSAFDDNGASPVVTEADCLVLRARLVDAEWQKLLAANAVYAMQTLELIVAALSAGWHQVFGVDDKLIDVETHGRDVLGDAVDSSESVGWFASFFPCRMTFDADIDSHLRQVKSSFRRDRIERRQSLLLRYLGPDGDDAASSSADESPTVLLNFFGGASPSSADGRQRFWTPAPLPEITLRSPLSRRAHQLELNLMVDAEGLQFVWRYSEMNVSTARVQMLDECTRETLNAISTHCASLSDRVYTPADFPDVDIDQDDLDNLLRDL